MTKFGVLGATALSLMIATPVLAQQAPAGHPGARAVGGNFGGARMGGAGPRVQSNFRGPQANRVGTANVAGRGNFAGRGNAQFAQGAYRGSQFRGDRGRGFGRDARFAAGAAAVGVAAGSALAYGNYGYDSGYYDPNYYGDSYAYDNGYGYDNGVTFNTGLPLVTFDQEAPVDQSTVAVGGDASYCAQRYRSYDPASGTYLGYDGLRHPCE
jgi:hypothetical protein